MAKSKDKNGKSAKNNKNDFLGENKNKSSGMTGKADSKSNRQP